MSESEILEDPVAISVSSGSGANDMVASTYVSEGRYQLLTAVISVTSTYACKASIGFKYTNPDGSVVVHMLHEGWVYNKNGLSLPSMREIRGPGTIYGTCWFPAANTLNFYCQYRRIRSKW